MRKTPVQRLPVIDADRNQRVKGFRISDDVRQLVTQCEGGAIDIIQTNSQMPEKHLFSHIGWHRQFSVRLLKIAVCIERSPNIFQYSTAAADYGVWSAYRAVFDCDIFRQYSVCRRVGQNLKSNNLNAFDVSLIQVQIKSAGIVGCGACSGPDVGRRVIFQSSTTIVVRTTGQKTGIVLYHQLVRDQPAVHDCFKFSKCFFSVFFFSGNVKTRINKRINVKCNVI